MSETREEVRSARLSSVTPVLPAASRLADAELARPVQAEARLPFTIRVVADDAALERALRMRQAAYQRHVPEFARTMDQAESYDRDPGSVVLLAESKLDGSPVGTMRIQTNRFRRLGLEESLELPEWLSGRLVGATRLGVESGDAGRMVKTALFKAFYLYCASQRIDWMVIAARTPLDRQYAALLFRDVYGEKAFIPLAHAANIPHRVMAFEIATAERRWRDAHHPLFDFVVGTHHPDIDLSAAPSLQWPELSTEIRHDSGRPAADLYGAVTR
ncbi:MAG: N-acyl amino acid synthase FeeM domain-containing protein [Janthinobacterium lividum]